jgi:hypothetical protein
MSTQEQITMGQDKAQSETVKHDKDTTCPEISKHEPVMRSALDDISIWASLSRYKVVTMIAMAAAFSAALDGYRETLFSKASAHRWKNIG